MRIKLLFTMLITLVITSCSHVYGSHGVIKDHDLDYLSAKSVPPLRIPPGYSSANITAHYPVSDRDYPNGVHNPDLTPPELRSYPK